MPIWLALAAGVSLDLARERAARLSDVSYELSFRVPASTAAPVTGTLLARFALSGDAPLAFDFKRPPGTALSVEIDGKPASFQETNEHVVLRLPPGRAVVGFTFTSGSGPLNRSPDFLYTLLVPARAREVFPCFDQPDVKARVALTLDLPAAWQAVANGRELARLESGGRAEVRFAETPPLSSYLFAFAAGKFSVEALTRGERTLRLFHRETDAAKLARNAPEIFALTFDSLDWLERYTGVPYPWDKLDLVLIPSFQYGGMEHPGAVFLYAERQLLDASATQDQRLKRASTIAHEAAHMWFGDLVTMRWFDDVWLKEVFANFLASKIVEPQFPEIDHALRFLLHHHPNAYEVDGTPGTHPILQPLPNLDKAGLMYGAIIYYKAPVVMRQLELLVGAEALRAGLGDYLRAFAFGNAAWADLLRVLERASGKPLAAFSRAWVSEAGRPVLRAKALGGGGFLTGVRLSQEDSAGRGRAWTQTLFPYLAGPGGSLGAMTLAKGFSEIGFLAPRPRPGALLPDGSGLAYGEQILDEKSRAWFLTHPLEASPATARASAWLALWDDVIAGRLSGRRYLDAARAALPLEKEELLVQRLLSTTAEAFWRFIPPRERAAEAARLEPVLLALATTASTPSLRKSALKGYWSVAQSESGVARLREAWEGRLSGGPELSEDDRSELALELALREGPAWADKQLALTANPDRRARLEFLKPALSPDAAVRAAFFGRLLTLEGRRREGWVAGSRRLGAWNGDALHLLNHPRRAQESLALLGPALETLEEIQRTGDIFFPAGWVSGALSGHGSPQAVSAVEKFLADRPTYPLPLKRLILQELHYVKASARASR